MATPAFEMTAHFAQPTAGEGERRKIMASSVTYTTGMDGGALAARAKQLGLERAHKERSKDDHHHETSGSLFVSLR